MQKSRLFEWTFILTGIVLLLYVIIEEPVSQEADAEQFSTAHQSVIGYYAAE